jgi:hypothetical protein
MAVVTELSSKATEFSGKYKVVIIRCDGASGAMTCAIDELAAVVSAQAIPAEAPTVTCAYFATTCTTANNIVTINAYKSDLVSTSTQTITDFDLVCIGY